MAAFRRSGRARIKCAVAASFGGVGLALTELLIAREPIESFLDEMEGANAEEVTARAIVRE